MSTRNLALLMAFTITLVACKTDQQFADKNQDRAEPIIEAIYQYKDDQASFPSELNELIPLYLESLPQTTSGDGFFYSTNDLDGFILAFTRSLNPREHFGCGYTDTTSSWECGYGD